MFGRSARAGATVLPGAPQKSRTATPSPGPQPRPDERPRRRWRLPKPGTLRILEFGKTKASEKPEQAGSRGETGRNIKIIYSDE
jgi:hypothetical protein